MPLYVTAAVCRPRTLSVVVLAIYADRRRAFWLAQVMESIVNKSSHPHCNGNLEPDTERHYIR